MERAMTFGQLLVELQSLKESDPKLLENDLVIRTDGQDYFVTLAVTLPGRQLLLLTFPEDSDAS